MSYTMKSSGVAWMGDIPAHWEVKRVKGLTKKVGRGQSPSYDDSSFQVVGQSCLSTYSLNMQKAKTAVTMSGNKGKFIAGDVLLASTGDGTLGKCALASTDGYCDGHVTVLNFKNKEDSYLFYFWASINFDFINSYWSKGATKQVELQKDDLLNHLLVVPPHFEKKAIIKFLNDRTSAIDSKISALEEKEQSLAELRKSIIHEAVTKGLDPKVPMKASGVDWIGDIAAHWSVKRLKDIASIQKGEVFPSNPISSGPLYPYFNGGRKPSGWSNNFNADENNIAVSEGGASAGYVHALKTKYWAGSHCYKVTARKKMSREYLYYVLKGFEDQFIASQTGSAMPNLQKSKFLNLLVSYTYDEKEQQAIAAYLDERTSVIDQSIDTVKKEIEALQELRKSLIHEAVTGKLDVADFGYNY